MYEAPTITEAGSVRDLTLAEGLWGNDDKSKYLHIPYGTDPGQS